MKCKFCGHTYDAVIRSEDGKEWEGECPSCRQVFPVKVPTGRYRMILTDADYSCSQPYQHFYEEGFSKVHAVYAFSTRQEFMKKWRQMVNGKDPNVGMWYWVFDNDRCLTSGACSDGDIEIFSDNWNISVEKLEAMCDKLTIKCCSTLYAVSWCNTGMNSNGISPPSFNRAEVQRWMRETYREIRENCNNEGGGWIGSDDYYYSRGCDEVFMGRIVTIPLPAGLDLIDRTTGTVYTSGPNQKSTVSEPWKIWFRRYDDQGNICGGGVLAETYTSKSSATRKARNHFCDKPNFTWIVCQKNPAEMENPPEYHK